MQRADKSDPYIIMSPTPFPRRRLGKTLRWYIAQELVFPTVISLVGLTTLVLTKDLLGFSDLVINRGFGASTVAWIAFYEVVPLIARTLPFAVLIGALVGLGRLRADLEILSLEAVGVPSRRLVGPVLTFAALATATGLFLSFSASPWASRSLDAALQQVAQATPGIALRPGTVHEFSGIKIAAREISARGDHLRGVLLWIPDFGHTIFAERGELASQKDGSAQLLLHDVEMLTSPRSGSGDATMRFGTFTTTLRQETNSSRSVKDSLAGESVQQLVILTQSDEEGGKTSRRALTELHRRFSHPVASLIFGLLAVPLSLCGRHFSRAAGAVAGLLMTVGYYGLVQLGEGLIQADIVTVGFGVWLPNITIGVFAILLLWQEHLRVVWDRRIRDGFFEQTSPGQEAPLPRARRYILQRYVVRQYLQTLFVSFALLLVGYLLVDMLERLEWFARYHTEALTIVQFYGARIPLLASRVIPMALLLATALTVSLFAAHRELIAMRACGLSVIHMLASILFICGLIAPGYFLLNEAVVPHTNVLADQIKDIQIKRRGPDAGLVHMAIWYWAGTHVSQATQLDAKLGEAQGVSIYELGEKGLPISRTDAQSARHIGNGIWELVEPRRVEISDQGLRETPATPFVRLGEAPSTIIDTMHLGTWQLARAIAETEGHGYDATKYRVDLHVKLASPLACLLLPTVVLFFAVGGPPFPSPALTLLASIVLGVGYILVTGVCASLGYGGFIPPSAAGWGPLSLLAVFTSFAAVRS